MIVVTLRQIKWCIIHFPEIILLDQKNEQRSNKLFPLIDVKATRNILFAL